MTIPYSWSELFMRTMVGILMGFKAFLLSNSECSVAPNVQMTSLFHHCTIVSTVKGIRFTILLLEANPPL